MLCRFNIIFLVLFVGVNCSIVPHADIIESSRDIVIREKRAIFNHTMALQRLTTLRSIMSRYSTPLAAVIIPTSDAHDSEYIAPVDARREWISGFTGSAGTAVVTSSLALVWTDGRYYTQFEKETDSQLWTLMKESLPETPSLETWLTTNLEEGAVVGADPYLTTRKDWTKIQTALQKANMQLIPVDKNLVDEARTQLNDPPPSRPANDVITLSIEYTGKSAGQKITEIRQKMAEKKATALIVTALDEVAYTLNLRGSDIEYNPVFFSYLLITTSSVDLFWGNGNLPATVLEQLKEEGVQNFTVKPYSDVVQSLEALALELSQSGDGRKSVWLSDVASEAVHRAAAGGEKLSKPVNLVSEVSPVAIAKLVKNDVELKGFRKCHIRDGIAVVRLFRWLDEQVKNGVQVTEIDASEKLLQFRQEETDFMGPSFETIAGAGENGAIIHYSPYTEKSKRVIRQGEVFLLDSGGQYRCGTTDITRTRFMGETAFDELKDRFTRVLIGQMTVGMALFPRGVKGNVLDSFARKALWDVGLDYAHGTGHGVGHFLNVHEGPSGVSWRAYPNDPGLAPGQILSNEPGYYKVGEYGIRHEDLVEIIAVTKNSDHPRASALVGDYDGRGVLGFSTLTLVPHHRTCIDVNMLNDIQLDYINAYHKRVLDTLGPILSSRGLHGDAEWLQRECAPLLRAVKQ